MPHQELNINFGSRVKMYLYTPKRGMPERELDCLNDTGDKNYQGIRGCSRSKSGGIKGVKPEPHKRNRRVHIYRGVVQLVECVVWDHEVAGSNPATPT